MSKTGKWVNKIRVLIAMVMAEGNIPVEEICKRLSITRDELEEIRTVLLMSGSGLEGGDMIDAEIIDGCFHLWNVGELKKPPAFTVEEVAVLQKACETLMNSGMYDKSGPMALAIEKVKKNIACKKEVERIASQIDMNIDEGSTDEIRRKIETAITTEKNVVIEYFTSSRNDKNKREVEPVGLKHDSGHWYVFGWCYLRKEERIFKLARIKSICLKARKGESKARLVDTTRSIGEYDIDKRSYNVKLRMSSKAGRQMKEYIDRATFFGEPDGTMIVKISTKNLEWLAKYLLRFGNDCEVESQDRLKKMTEENKQKVLEIYQK
jgi:predicted DNA-binding transcriptional regulator YafY